MKRSIIVLAANLFFFVAELMSQSAFHSAEGFGARTRSAYGSSTPPKILFVNSLLDNNSGDESTGKGTLRWCLTRNYPRIVLFEVGGTIELNDIINIESPYMFVAGQSAPSPGILIINATIVIKTHNILVQHLSIRAGDNPNGSVAKGRDCLALFSSSCHDVIVDHCSLLWAVDENISIWGNGTPISNFTVSNCIIAQGLHHSIHPDGEHSKGFLVGYRVQNVSIVKNLIAHNDDRNPLLQGGSVTEIVNNIVYNGINAISFENNNEYISKSAIINNTITAGNDFKDDYLVKLGYLSLSSEIFLSGNSGTQNDWDFVYGRNYIDAVKVNSPPVNSNNIDVIEKNELDSFIIKNVGSRPWERNLADVSVVESYINGTGNIIDCVDANNCSNNAGGWYLLESSRRTISIPDRPHMDDDSDGYTNIEEWIQAMPAGVVTETNSETQSDLLIFPNPTNGMIKILLPEANTLDYNRLKISTLEGKTVVDEVIDINDRGDENRLVIDLTGLAQGIYILSLSNYFTVQTQKIVKI